MYVPCLVCHRPKGAGLGHGKLHTHWGTGICPPPLGRHQVCWEKVGEDTGIAGTCWLGAKVAEQVNNVSHPPNPPKATRGWGLFNWGLIHPPVVVVAQVPVCSSSPSHPPPSWELHCSKKAGHLKQ